ncbi:S-formylglutathione hydrolase [Salinisphaera sp. G21_0]|nr:S-formylglutathione hydrolase [Salinisphaera sp. G21_0]MBO9481346.1 S-formylglutathione hydrolase [Salinisphaera sp. G21_0]
MENISSNKLFGGWHKQYTHDSQTLNCNMRFAIYLPPESQSKTVPVLYWLSGLTCTDENFMQKSGAQRVASELGIAIVAPDTSPRGDDVPDDPDAAYDFGLGAGFYVNATRQPWRQHYQMYDYVVSELPELIEQQFPVNDKRSIAGHSMGGHGALVIALHNPDRYSSVSAFSPICNPVNAPWGQKAFMGYLGNDREQWKHYDACELLKISPEAVPALVDQGSRDTFLHEQLHLDALKKAVADTGYPMTIRMQEGYDHSYHFIATFIEDHLRFHSQKF